MKLKNIAAVAAMLLASATTMAAVPTSNFNVQDADPVLTFSGVSGTSFSFNLMAGFTYDLVLSVSSKYTDTTFNSVTQTTGFKMNGVVFDGHAYQFSTTPNDGPSSLFGGMFVSQDFDNQVAFNPTGLSAGPHTLTVTSSTGNNATFNGTLDVTKAYAVSAPVPEPETYAMLLAGLGALGFVGRRRRTQDV
ncbi:MAG: hypothetical protein RIQ60_4279 [Pseudomonadota bacterium]|jgi:hypothetical protein